MPSQFSELVSLKPFAFDSNSLYHLQITTIYFLSSVGGETAEPGTADAVIGQQYKVMENEGDKKHDEVSPRLGPIPGLAVLEEDIGVATLHYAPLLHHQHPGPAVSFGR